MAAFFASLAVVGSGFASLLPPNASAGSAYKMDEETSTTASLLVGFESADDDASIVTVHFLLPSFFFFKEEEDFVNVWWRGKRAEENESVNMCATSIVVVVGCRSEGEFCFKKCGTGEKLFVFLCCLTTLSKIRKISRAKYV